MAKARKVIITCAVTGSIHTPSMSPHLPITAQEIADAAIGAAEAGAAIVHLHARDPKDGRPDQSPEAFAPFLKVIKQRSNCVVNITTGGAPTMTIEERVRPAATFKPEVASLNMGSMNFGLYPMLARQKEFKHDWEKPYLEGSRERIFKNTFADIEYILTTCANNGTRFEIECYDIGHLYTLRALRRPRRGQAAVLRPERVRHPGRHRPAPRGRAAHEAHGRPAVRRASITGACWARGATRCRSRRRRRPWAATCASAWRTRCGSARAAGEEQCRAGEQGAPDHRGPGARDRLPRRGARDAAAQGRRQGGVLTRRAGRETPRIAM